MFWFCEAIWLWPRDEVYGQWPASGEIDIMEARSNRNLVDAGGVNIGVEQATATMHWGPNPDWNQHARTHWTLNSAPGEGWDQYFHSYRIEWTPGNIELKLLLSCT